MPTLHDLMPPDAVRVDVHAHDWRQAVTESGALLATTGVADQAYIGDMIRNVEEHGPYIVIAPGFAFAHARGEGHVHRTGLSAVRLADPVEFGHDSNDPVTLVVALASVDADAHQEALAELARLLSDPDRRARLDEARTPEELRAAFAAPDAGPTTMDSSAAAASSTTVEPAPAAPTITSAPATTAAPAATAPAAGEAAPSPASDARAAPPRGVTDVDTVASKEFILTVCGNGLGTSLFLKNTLEGVLDRWGWGPYIRVEATDTISARGRAKEADVLFTSGAIAQTLGEVGVPVEVIDDFTSTTEIDAALRRVYAV